MKLVFKDIVSAFNQLIAKRTGCKHLCTALVVGCDDVASCYSVGVLTRRQVGSWEGSREARVVADS